MSVTRWSTCSCSATTSTRPATSTAGSSGCGRRAPAARVPGLLAVRGATPCLHIAERRRTRARRAARAGCHGAARAGPVDHIAFSAADYEAADAARAHGVPPCATPSRAARASCSSTTRTACGSRSTSNEEADGRPQTARRRRPRRAAVPRRPRRQPAAPAGAAARPRGVRGRADHRRASCARSRTTRSATWSSMQQRRRAAVGDRRRVPPRVVAHGLHLPARRDREGARRHQGPVPQRARATSSSRRRRSTSADRVHLDHTIFGEDFEFLQSALVAAASRRS